MHMVPNENFTSSVVFTALDTSSSQTSEWRHPSSRYFVLLTSFYGGDSRS
jgi:hypothetical protein